MATSPGQLEASGDHGLRDANDEVEGAVVVAHGSRAAAVAGLVRSDVRGPGLSRVRDASAFSHLDHGAVVADPATLSRIADLAIPPAWRQVWISPDPLGHVQVTGIDSRGRLEYRYQALWREQRDAQKFQHMLRFARALPRLREACLADLRRRRLNRERVAAAAVRLIDLGLFRIGGERYAELDHHYAGTCCTPTTSALT